MRVAEIARADARHWFDSMSATSGNANRTLPVLSVMMRQAGLWDLRPQGSNPCRNMRRYRTVPRELFLSLAELKHLSFVLDYAEDKIVPVNGDGGSASLRSADRQPRSRPGSPSPWRRHCMGTGKRRRLYG